MIARTAVLLLALATPAVAQDTHLLVITGVSGDEEHARLFHEWATTLIDAARRTNGVADDNIVYLAESTAVDRAVRDRSTRENVENAFNDLATHVKPSDDVFIVLFGHGTFDGHQAAFNLPGPDLKAADYARLLSKIPSQRIAFVNTTSASGAFLDPLAGPGRVIVTATKTGGERLDTRFPEFFVQAFVDPAADKNRDGRVSIQEAFDYAHTKVVQAYEQKGLILTEHAALEDGSEGRFAATVFLESTRARTAALGASTSNPAMRALLEQKQALEDQIAALKLKKGLLPEDQYAQQLEKLVTELALKTRAIQQLEGRK